MKRLTSIGIAFMWLVFAVPLHAYTLIWDDPNNPPNSESLYRVFQCDGRQIRIARPDCVSAICTNVDAQLDCMFDPYPYWQSALYPPTPLAGITPNPGVGGSWLATWPGPGNGIVYYFVTAQGPGPSTLESFGSNVVGVNTGP